MARHAEVVAPASKLKLRIAEVLKDEGYIAGYDAARGRGHEQHRGAPALGRPAHQRHHRAAPPLAPGPAHVRHATDTIPKVRSGLGIAILSTSRGLMTDRAARKAGVGGELLCEVW